MHAVNKLRQSHPLHADLWRHEAIDLVGHRLEPLTALCGRLIVMLCHSLDFLGKGRRIVGRLVNEADEQPQASQATK